MEENNRKGPGVFYAVVGVATLVVAIIGATFAYFSASQENTKDITGQTLDITTDFKLNVERVKKSTSVASDNLVPTDISSTTADINTALNAECVADGYTGCHVYKITASSGQTLETASMNLTLTQTGATKKDNWKYVVYTGTDDSATALVDGLSGSFDLSTAADMHKGATITGGTTVTYYLMIYLADDNTAQNENGQTGSYSGTVVFQAAGGQVSASFKG